MLMGRTQVLRVASERAGPACAKPKRLHFGEGRGPRSMRLTFLGTVVAYAGRPLSLEGSASCSRASMICLQRQHAVEQHRRLHSTAFPGPYAVRKNSRSPAGV